MITGSQNAVVYDNELGDGSNVTFPADTWFLPGSAGDIAGKLVPTEIGINMHYAGTGYQFGWQ